LKVLDDFQLSFRLKDYPLDISGQDVTVGIAVRPEATVMTFAHAAFTVRQVIFAPLDEPGVVILLDVDSVLPMTITGAFRPRLRLSRSDIRRRIVCLRCVLVAVPHLDR